MGSFPQHFFPVIIVSLFLSSVGMVFAGLSLDSSPIIWLVPAVIIITFSHHTYILLVGYSETYSSPRIYTSTPVACGYILAFLWSAALATAVTLTCLLLSGIMSTDEDKVKIWMPIVAGISLVEALIVLYISIQSHREMKRINYRNKWKWRIDAKGGSPTPWNISRKGSV